MKKLLLFFAILCISNVCVQAATDNVLQSVQIDSFKDTYNIVLKSDEKPEAKRIINDENKMMLTLKGVRVSKDFNTIYNATNIDSVTVEPTGSDSVNISIQAQNVSRSNLIFDTLDTPLGVLRAKDNKTGSSSASKTKSKKAKKKIVLSQPINQYRPVFNDDAAEESMSFDSLMVKDYANSFISSFKEDGITNMITIALIGIIILCTVKLFRKNNKEDDIQVGLTQSLKDREMSLMQDFVQSQQTQQVQPQKQQIRPEMLYGINSYQNTIKAPYQQRGMKSPYTTSDIKFNSSAFKSKFQNLQQNDNGIKLNMSKPMNDIPAVAAVQPRANRMSQSVAEKIQKPVSSRVSNAVASKTVPNQQKVSGVNTIEFLNEISKIYEKNGRADLAQGLKSKMKRI